MDSVIISLQRSMYGSYPLVLQVNNGGGAVTSPLS